MAEKKIRLSDFLLINRGGVTYRAEVGELPTYISLEEPSSPVAGDMYYDPIKNILYVYDGNDSKWKAQGVSYGNIEPKLDLSSPGQLFYDTTENRLKQYDPVSNAYIDAAPEVLEDLLNVTGTADDGDFLVYDASANAGNGAWVPTALTDLGININLEDLDNIEGAPSDNHDFISYDASKSKWEVRKSQADQTVPSTVTIDGTTIVTNASGQLSAQLEGALTFRGTVDFVAEAYSAGGLKPWDSAVTGDIWVHSTNVPANNGAAPNNSWGISASTVSAGDMVAKTAGANWEVIGRVTDANFDGFVAKSGDTMTGDLAFNDGVSGGNNIELNVDGSAKFVDEGIHFTADLANFYEYSGKVVLSITKTSGIVQLLHARTQHEAVHNNDIINLAFLKDKFGMDPTDPDATDGFVKVSGDTMTGPLEIGGSDAIPLKITNAGIVQIAGSVEANEIHVNAESGYTTDLTVTDSKSFITLGQVDTKLGLDPSDPTKSAYVKKAGDVMDNGATIELGKNPDQPMDAATRKYVDDSVASFSSTLEDLEDTEITTVADGEYLVWDAAADSGNGAWVNREVDFDFEGALAFKGNVDTTQPYSGSRNNVIGGEVNGFVTDANGTPLSSGDFFVQDSADDTVVSDAAWTGISGEQVPDGSMITYVIESVGGTSKYNWYLTGSSGGSGGSFVAKAGDTMTGDLSFDDGTNGQKVLIEAATGNTLIEGTLSVNSLATFNDDLTVGGVASLDTLTVATSSTFDGTFTVNVDGEFKNDVIVDRDAIITRNLDVSGDSSLTTLDVSGAAVFGSGSPGTTLSSYAGTAANVGAYNVAVDSDTTGLVLVHKGYVADAISKVDNFIERTNDDILGYLSIYEGSIAGGNEVVKLSNVKATPSYFAAAQVDAVATTGKDIINKDYLETTLVFNDLSDVEVTTATGGEYAYHNGTNWVNKAIALGDISGIDGSGATDGDILVYDSGEFKPDAGIAAAGVLGRVKIGDGIDVNVDGEISVDITGGITLRDLCDVTQDISGQLNPDPAEVGDFYVQSVNGNGSTTHASWVGLDDTREPIKGEQIVWTGSKWVILGVVNDVRLDEYVKKSGDIMTGGLLFDAGGPGNITSKIDIDEVDLHYKSIIIEGDNNSGTVLRLQNSGTGNEHGMTIRDQVSSFHRDNIPTAQYTIAGSEGNPDFGKFIVNVEYLKYYLGIPGTDGNAQQNFVKIPGDTMTGSLHVGDIVLNQGTGLVTGKSLSLTAGTGVTEVFHAAGGTGKTATFDNLDVDITSGSFLVKSSNNSFEVDAAGNVIIGSGCGNNNLTIKSPTEFLCETNFDGDVTIDGDLVIENGGITVGKIEITPDGGISIDGSVIIDPSNPVPQYLRDLLDCANVAAIPGNGEVLMYSTLNGWINSPIPPSGILSINTTILPDSTGNVELGLDDLYNVNTSLLQPGQVLEYKGTTAYGKSFGFVDPIDAIGDLSDVEDSGADDTHIFVYDKSQTAYVNTPTPLAKNLTTNSTSNPLFGGAGMVKVADTAEIGGVTSNTGIGITGDGILYSNVTGGLNFKGAIDATTEDVPADAEVGDLWVQKIVDSDPSVSKPVKAGWIGIESALVKGGELYGAYDDGAGGIKWAIIGALSDANLDGYVRKTGDTMTGALIMLDNLGNPIVTLENDGKVTGKDLEITNDATVTNDLVVKKKTTLGTVCGDTLTVQGDSTFKCAVTFEKDVSFEGDLTLEKDLHVKGDVTLDKNVTIGGKCGDGDVTINANSTFNCPVFITEDISISGDKITIASDITMTGDIDLTGNLDVTGDTTLTGNLDVTGDVGITGDLTLIGDLSLTGGDFVIGTDCDNDSLTVKSPATFECDTTIKNDSGDSVVISDGVVTINKDGADVVIDGGKITADGDIIGLGDLTISNDGTILGKLDVTGNGTFENNLTVKKDLVVGTDCSDGKLEVKSPATFACNVSVGTDKFVIDLDADTISADIGAININTTNKTTILGNVDVGDSGSSCSGKKLRVYESLETYCDVTAFIPVHYDGTAYDKTSVPGAPAGYQYTFEEAVAGSAAVPFTSNTLVHKEFVDTRILEDLANVSVNAETTIGNYHADALMVWQTGNKFEPGEIPLAKPSVPSPYSDYANDTVDPSSGGGGYTYIRPTAGAVRISDEAKYRGQIRPSNIAMDERGIIYADIPNALTFAGTIDATQLDTIPSNEAQFLLPDETTSDGSSAPGTAKVGDFWVYDGTKGDGSPPDWSDPEGTGQSTTTPRDNNVADPTLGWMLLPDTVTPGDMIVRGENQWSLIGSATEIDLTEYVRHEGDTMTGTLQMTSNSSSGTVANIDVTEGNISVTLGDITAAEGNITAAEGDIEATQGNIIAGANITGDGDLAITGESTLTGIVTIGPDDSQLAYYGPDTIDLTVLNSTIDDANGNVLIPKSYVEDALSKLDGFVEKPGDTMTGGLFMAVTGASENDTVGNVSIEIDTDNMQSVISGTEPGSFTAEASLGSADVTGSALAPNDGAAVSISEGYSGTLTLDGSATVVSSTPGPGPDGSTIYTITLSHAIGGSGGPETISFDSVFDVSSTPTAIRVTSTTGEGATALETSLPIETGSANITGTLGVSSNANVEGSIVVGADATVNHALTVGGLVGGVNDYTTSGGGGITPGDSFVGVTGTSPNGDGAVFTVNGNLDGSITVIPESRGSNYHVNDVITVDGADVGGGTDLLITVTSTTDSVANANFMTVATYQSNMDYVDYDVISDATLVKDEEIPAWKHVRALVEGTLLNGINLDEELFQYIFNDTTYSALDTTGTRDPGVESRISVEEKHPDGTLVSTQNQIINIIEGNNVKVTPYDDTTNSVQGIKIEAFSAKVTVSSSAPNLLETLGDGSPAYSEGDLWYNATDGRLYIAYYSAFGQSDPGDLVWVDASPATLNGDDFLAKSGDTMNGSLHVDDELTFTHMPLDTLPALASLTP